MTGYRKGEVSRPDKVFFPGDGIEKGHLAEYYQHVAATILRYTRERPVAAERFPDGITGERIFQKNVGEHFPSWIPRVEVPKKEGGETLHAVCDDAATLGYLVDQGCITPHVWLARTDALERPDRLIFDLDPADEDLDLLRFAARRVRELLEGLGLVPFLMTTGSRGFHVLVPLRREDYFDTVRGFTREAATLLAEQEPRALTVEQRKEDRGQRVFLDYLRNAYAQTSVVPYAVRAKPAAPVATPLSWDELESTEPWRFTIAEVPQRLRRDGDPWSGLGNHARSLARPRRELDRVTTRNGRA